MELIKNLKDYRELLKTNVKKDIRGKYKRSFLGVLWSFINPLLQTIVYTIVFSTIMRSNIDNYLIYVVTGFIPWAFFSGTILQGISVITNNAGIIKKVYFPREILPISSSLSGLVNFMISCTIIVIFCLFSVGISWHIVFVPIIALIQFILILGIVMALCAINLYVQDTEYIIQFVLNMAFYATPVLYETKTLPVLFQTVLKLNPMSHILDAYRYVFMYHCMPDMSKLMLVAILAVIIFFIGYVVFKKLEKGFAEQI